MRGWGCLGAVCADTVLMTAEPTLLNRIVLSTAARGALGGVLTGDRLISKLTPWRSGDRHVYEISSTEPLLGPDATHRLGVEVFGDVPPEEMFLCALAGKQRTVVVNQPLAGKLPRIREVTVTATWSPQLAIAVRHAESSSSSSVYNRRAKTPRFGTTTPEQEMPQVRSCFECLPTVLDDRANGFYSVTYLFSCGQFG